MVKFKKIGWCWTSHDSLNATDEATGGQRSTNLDEKGTEGTLLEQGHSAGAGRPGLGASAPWDAAWDAACGRAGRASRSAPPPLCGVVALGHRSATGALQGTCVRVGGGEMEVSDVGEQVDL